MNDAIIISDIHLGSSVCESKQLLSFLNSVFHHAQCLIINGDLFDNLDFRRLKKNHWKVLSLLRRLSKFINVIWIRGNHDGEAEIISHLVGLDFKNEYTFESGNKKILCLHGDKFDDFIYKYPKTTKIADLIYRTIQRFDKRFISRFIKKGSKIYLRCNDNIIYSSKKYAENKGVDFVCLGHTHYPCVENSGEVHYYNSGCWTEKKCSFLSVKNGVINLEFYE